MMKRTPGSFTLAALCLGLVGTPLSAQTQFGNPWYFGNGYSAPASETTTPWFTFTAPENTTVSGARFVANSITPGTDLTVSIKAVDGTGRPTGSALGSNTFQPGNAFDWNAVSLPNVALTAGTVYAVELTSTTPGGSFNWRANGGPTGGSQPYGTVDPSFLSGWQSNAPEHESYIWVLETDMGRAIGQPYRSSTLSSVAQDVITLGQHFIFDSSQAGGNRFVESVTIPLTIASVAPSSPLTLNVISTSGEVLGTSILDLSGQAEGMINAVFQLPSEVELSDGEGYYLGLFSNGSAFHSVDWAYYSTDNDPLYNSATFQGTDGYAVLWGTQSNFAQTPDSYFNRDYSFMLSMSNVPEPSVVALIALGGLAGVVALRRRGRVEAI